MHHHGGLTSEQLDSTVTLPAGGGGYTMCGVRQWLVVEHRSCSGIGQPQARGKAGPGLPQSPTRV